MLKLFLFVAIATVQCTELKEKLNREPATKVLHLSPQQGHRLHGFRPRSDWSWMPSMPSFFKFDEDDDDDVTPKILRKLEAVERMLKEMIDRMKKGSNTGEERNARFFGEDEGDKKPESTSTEPSTPAKETASSSTTTTTTTTSKPIQSDAPPSSQKPETVTTPAEKPTEASAMPENTSTTEPPAKTTEAKQDESSTQNSAPAEEKAMEPY